MSLYMPLILNHRWLHHSRTPSCTDIGADALIETEGVKKRAAVSLVYFSSFLKIGYFLRLISY